MEQDILDKLEDPYHYQVKKKIDPSDKVGYALLEFLKTDKGREWVMERVVNQCLYGELGHPAMLEGNARANFTRTQLIDRNNAAVEIYGIEVRGDEITLTFRAVRQGKTIFDSKEHEKFNLGYRVMVDTDENGDVTYIKPVTWDLVADTTEEGEDHNPSRGSFGGIMSVDDNIASPVSVK